MLKPFVVLSAVAMFAFAPLVASAASPQVSAPVPDATNPVKPTPQSRAKAKEVYQRDCALCHGDSGDGKTDLAKDMQLTLLDWTDPKSLSGQSDQALFNVIRHGKDKMPSEESGRASDTEVWNLILYIRGMAREQPAAPAAPVAVTPTTAPSR